MDTPQQCYRLANSSRPALGFKILPAALLLGLFLMTTNACSSRLCGTLVDPEGEVIREGRVFIRPVDHGKKQQGFWVNVNSRGHFEVEQELSSGFYFIETLVPGYQTSSLRLHFSAPQDLKLPLQKQTPPQQALKAEGTPAKSAKLDLQPPPAKPLPQEPSHDAQPHTR